MSVVDFEAWALPNLELELGGRIYTVRPPSVDAGKKVLAAAVRAEVNLGLAKGPVPDEIQRVLDSIESGDHPALGADVYAALVADGHPQAVIDRMAYYAVFYWVRGHEYANTLAALLWKPTDSDGGEASADAPKGL